jgi:hypothetical protein
MRVCVCVCDLDTFVGSVTSFRQRGERTAAVV